ncbi:MAG: hypothetical protein GC162_02880 [Planctomycetes bacterium]|nr:hypothetical protein [Planctomycetota bacterium]
MFDQRTVMFIVFVLFSMACFAMGYAARKRGWAPERWSRPIHLHTVIWLWSPVTLFAFWGLKNDAARDVTTLMICEPILMIAAALVMLLLVILARCPRKTRGVMIIASVISNHGFTLGAYLCYALLEPHDDALRYGIAFVTSMQMFMVLLFYPVAAHYGSDGKMHVGRLMLESFITPRATPLYMALVGLALKFSGIPVPTQIAQWHVMDILFFAGAAGSHIGIGLRFRFGDTAHTLHLHGLLALVQFVAHPVLTAALLAAMTAAGHPPSRLVHDVMIIEAFVPTGLNTVIIANLFHLEPRLASGLWLWNMVLFCVIIVPGLLWVWG